MRKVISALVLLCSLAVREGKAQQPLEVVIVATSHYNGSKPAEYRPVIEKLKAYRPDMVFGEYLTAVDAQQLPADQAMARSYQRWQKYLQRRELTATPLTAKQAAAAQRRLRKAPTLVRPRVDLARYYTAGYDRGNAEYQLYLLEEPLKGLLTAADRTYYTQAFGPADSLRKVKLVRPLTEYHTIIFPLLHELGQEQIFGMDCQRYDGPWNTASGQAYTQYVALQKGFKVDSTTAQAATYRRIDGAKTAYFAHLNTAPTDADAYRLLNTPAYEKLDAALNFYGGEALYGAPGFPTQAVQDMHVQWKLRNQGMCENVVRQARAQKAKRVLVAVGASHGQAMREILAQMPQVRVRIYNDLP
ncbi:DUF5694 domain-containing protein [Hymenobacter norwichensis]|uniref:DUF5694 domain-containing protein n=1 Tax=Hymenobacter norwichensis TaxID=223903 RepID=UPI0012FA0D4E|nr:DUF5694 domain-containing protein [Hymenobacter norwichensis]